MTDDFGREAMAMVERTEVRINAVWSVSSLIASSPVNLTIPVDPNKADARSD